MRTLHRAFRRRFRRHVRFNVAVMLTILVVAWVAVPGVARFVNSWAGYEPVGYEPKDLDRQMWLERNGAEALLERLPWNDVIGIGLFVLVAVLWLTLVPDRAGRRRPPP
jgi:hypothetical protein